MNALFKFALKIRDSLNCVGDYNYVSKRDMDDSIQKVIHQTYHKNILPPEIQDNVNYLKLTNPDWEHRLYDDDDILNYIEKNYPELTKIYNKINPLYGAARADFFRYLLIYNEGGVYLDIKSTIIKPLKDVLTKDDRYLLSYWQNGPNSKQPDIGLHSCISNPFGELQQWHIVAVKGHPFLKAVIENVCNNIQNYNPLIHETGRWGVINLTGPIAYSLAIEANLDKYPHRLERDNTKFGFVYSIFQLKDFGFSHHKLLNKHYTLLDDSIIRLPILHKVIFNLLKPLIKLIKNLLITIR